MSVFHKCLSTKSFPQDDRTAPAGNASDGCRIDNVKPLLSVTAPSCCVYVALERTSMAKECEEENS